MRRLSILRAAAMSLNRRIFGPVRLRLVDSIRKESVEEPVES